jgi:hypothetical protein
MAAAVRLWPALARVDVACSTPWGMHTQLITHTQHPPTTFRRQENAPECAFDMWMHLEQTPFWWDKLFRFTAVEFFFELVPHLHLPPYFRVDG